MRACIFDLDGTLVDTLPTIHHVCNQALTHFGFRNVGMDDVRELCRLSIHEFYPLLLRKAGCPEERIAEMEGPMQRHDVETYLKDRTRLTKPFEGIPELINELRARGVICAVLTNKPAPIAEQVADAFFPGAFAEVRGQTVETISKPDPRSLWNLLGTLGVAKEDCVYVGDTDVDMRTAKNAGVQAVAVGWGYQSLESLHTFTPEYTVEKAAELLPLFPA